MTAFWRKVVVRLGYLASGLVIFAALLVSVSRLLTPVLNEHLQTFEDLAAHLLGRPVHIGEVSISWDFYEPEFALYNVTVLDPKTQQTNIEIPLIQIDLAIWKSILKRQFLLDSLKITGASLTLHEQKKGGINIEGFSQVSMTDQLTGQSVNPNEMLTWIFSQPKLVLQKIDIHYFSNDGEEKNVKLKWLALKNSSNSHQLIGKAVLIQKIPTQVKINFNWQGNITDIPHISAELFLDLEGISLAQWSDKPIWNGLRFNDGFGSAKILATWGQNSWQKFQTNLQFFNVSMVLDSVFGNPIEFNQVKGIINLQKDSKDPNGSWLLSTKNVQVINTDMTAAADIAMTIPQHDSPTINLTGDFRLAHAKNINLYLPLKIFEPALIDWLRHAFVDGQADAGKIVVQGKLSDFPFDNGTGKFEISGLVKNVELHYAPNWPNMKNIDGKLVFSGNSMTVDIVSANLFGVPLNNVHGEIPSLGNNPILTTKSTVQSDLSQGMQLIQHSPLQNTIGKNLAALNLQGPMQLDLNLSVPLKHPEDTKVLGDTKISNSTLTLGDWNLAINQLNGEFNFTEDSITGSAIKGRLFGNPVTLDLTTQHPTGQSAYVSAILQTVLNTAPLQAWLNLPVEEIMQGSTPIKVEVTLPPQGVTSRSKQINIATDLKGIAVNLPGVYGKKKEDTADFQLNFILKENQPLKAKLNYNKLFSVAMSMQRVKQKFDLLSADLHLGTGDADWQTLPGIVISGNLDRIDWDVIQPYISPYMTETKTSKSKKSDFINPDLFRGLNLRTNTLNFNGLKLSNLNIQLSKTPSQFILGLNNADMDGQIILPRSGMKQGIHANFQRINLSSQMSVGGKTSVNPRSLPPISFVGNDVRFGDMNIGHAILNLVPVAGGMAVRQLDLSSSNYKLHAEGSWTTGRTRLQGNLSTSNVSELLKSWGFSSNNLMGGTGDVNFDLNWPGSFLQPSTQALSGTVSLNIANGRIVNLGDATDAKMGLGRLLNIFSLQSLPRHLSLNFSDVFEKGYSFDSLTGDFNLRNGNANTQNTQFQGTIAKIELSGRIGLAAKDLDMKISVTPYVTSSLPVVAAIATANPVAGVAAFVVDKMVSPAVSHLTTYNYSITGSWANPLWNQISAQSSMQLSPKAQSR